MVIAGWIGHIYVDHWGVADVRVPLKEGRGRGY